jgi:phosphoribosylformylglycinamidine synthase
MLSESQERMVMVVERGREESVERIFARWGLEAVAIGELTRDGRARLLFHGQVAADLPIGAIVSGASELERQERKPSETQRPTVSLPGLDDIGGALRSLLATPDLGDKSWIYEQYDSTVRSNTVVGPGADAALLRLKGTHAGLALVAGVNPVYCALDPRRGAQQAVAEAVRNLACVGAEPLALTDCLNFGNPENPEVAWQFREAVEGLAEACRSFGVPVISGNVSFYNETEGVSIYPTPTVAVLGSMPEIPLHIGPWFANAGDRIVVLGEDALELGGSAYLRLLHGVEVGPPPRVDLEAEANLAALLRFAIGEGWIKMAHDIGEGGLAVALAEACFGKGLGASLELEGSPHSLFSETQARAIIAIEPAALEGFLETAAEFGVPARVVGTVGGDRLQLRVAGETVRLSLGELYEPWKTALPRALGA